VKPNEVKELPSRPATVNHVLPLLPGITRASDGGLRMNGGGEQRGAMLVNRADVTDPATGSFGGGVPIDSVQEIGVYATPFLAQDGRFTSGVVAVETKRGSDKWHFEINDPFPDFRFCSWQLRGLQDASPRLVAGGPLFKKRIYFAQTVLFDFRKIPNRTLPFPDNTSKQQRINSFTQFDFNLSAKQYITATLHITPQRINYVNPDYFNPEPVTPRLFTDIKVSPKYTVRLSATGHNLTNHFNALAVHANVADPAFGVFFGDYPRRFRADFGVIF